MHDAVARECRTTRESSRPVRCFDARQDRGRRPGCGDFPRAHVRQRVPEARSRPLPLRPHAERSGFPHGRRGDRSPRARPVPCDDDDRRRAARARPDGGLSSDRVHRPQGLADLDDRAMGDDRGAGAESARLRRPAHRRCRSRQRSHAPHGRARSARLRRSGAAHAGQLHRRARLRDQRALPFRPRGLGGGVARGREARRLRLRHRGDACDAGREGLRHRRPGDRRHGDARRPWPRLGDREDRRRISSASARLFAPTCWRRIASSSSGS